jgi:phosphoribosylformylglycinamidine cyclo-ligase
MAITYKDAGVDIDAGNSLVDRIKPLARATMRPEVVGGIGGFAALCSLPGKYKEPLLVSGTDGVGTKLKTAFATGRHDTIGIDLVAMCVNDVLVTGAEPLFFLDYYATGKLSVDVAAAVVGGIAEGCKQAGCALVGGETAELPGLYREGDFDLAGFAVGLVEAEQVPRGPVTAGDVVLGLPSSGVHANGLSLARRALDRSGICYDDWLPELGATVGETLLVPTCLYVRPVLALLSGLAPARIKAAAHITGGGLLGRARKLVPPGLRIEIDPRCYQRPPIFDVLARAGDIAEPELARTFNMGLGFLIVVAAEDAGRALAVPGTAARKVGRIVRAASAHGPAEVDLGYAAS